MMLSISKSLVSLSIALSLTFSLSACKTNTTNSNDEQPQLAPAADEAPADKICENTDGWSVNYNTKHFKYNELNPHSAQFDLTDTNNNFVKISYITNKQPEEALTELTSSWNNDDNIKRSQQFFPGTKDKWAFKRSLSIAKDNAHIQKMAIAAEYNDGILLIESASATQNNAQLIDQLINSIAYKDFKPQKMYDYVPGSYLAESKDVVTSISLNEDHTGSIQIQNQKIDITWGSYELYTNDGKSYEYSIEGTNLNFKYDDRWLPLQKAPIAKLPPYKYLADDPIAAAVANYLVTEINKLYKPADVCIPSFSIVATDSDDPNDIRVWGDFWIFNYKLNNDTLLNESGGSHAGLMHLKKSESDYSVTSMDTVEDGANNLKSAKQIFADHYDDFHKINSNQDEREKVRLSFIADYVRVNSLPITKTKNFGWDPIDLPK